MERLGLEGGNPQRVVVLNYYYYYYYYYYCYLDLYSEDISSALQYSSERVSLVAILLPLRISQEQGVRKETKDNGGFETEHQGRIGSSFSQHAAMSEAKLLETLGGMC